MNGGLVRSVCVVRVRVECVSVLRAGQVDDHYGEDKRKRAARGAAAAAHGAAPSRSSTRWAWAAQRGVDVSQRTAKSLTLFWLDLALRSVDFAGILVD